MPARSLTHLTSQPIHWLWPQRLALGKLALLEGDPGRGKSLITLDLAARLSRGAPWPDDPSPPLHKDEPGEVSPPSPPRGEGPGVRGRHATQAPPDSSPPLYKGGPGGVMPANVLLYCAEDHDADTLKPRLEALGADMDRIFAWPTEQAFPRFPSQLDLLDNDLARIAPQLVILDPIMAFLDPNVVVSSETSVRRVLQELQHRAHRHRCAILLVRHLNKRPGLAARYRGIGSIAFQAACRLTSLVAPDPDDDRRSVLASVKTNYAPAPSLAYQIESPPLHKGGPGGVCASPPSPQLPPPSPPRGEGPGVRGRHAMQAPPDSAPPLHKGGPGGVLDSPPNDPAPHPRITWLGPSPYTSDDLVSNRPPSSPDRTRARHLLNTLLQNHPMLYSEIKQAAQKAALSRRTLMRAKKDLDIRSQRTYLRQQRLDFWLLPTQQLPTNECAPDLAPLLQPLDAQFNSPSETALQVMQELSNGDSNVASSGERLRATYRKPLKPGALGCS